jgi:starch phosphorylase
MSTVGLELSGFVNGVSIRHAEVSRGMFPGHPIHAVTNGVHSATWTVAVHAGGVRPPHPGWRRQGHALRNAQRIPTARDRRGPPRGQEGADRRDQFMGEHNLDPDRFTIGFARRVTSYKRINLLLRDVRRLREIAEPLGLAADRVLRQGPPARPRGQAADRGGVPPAGGAAAVRPPGVRAGLRHAPRGKIVAGVDLWLNTPMPPLEASGTSGHEGGPQRGAEPQRARRLVVRGLRAGHTGWVIEPPGEGEGAVDDRDADHLYRILDNEVLHMYVGNQARWGEVMRDCIALAASYFNSQRMVEEYVTRAYGLTLAR